MKTIIAAMQMIVANEARIKLSFDGDWGPLSRAAYASLNADHRNAIASAVSALGYDPAFLDAKEGEISEAIRTAAEITRQDFGFLYTVAEIESSLNPSAANGKHKGLYQMSRDAWADASMYLENIGSISVDYDSNVFDPNINAVYGAAYLALTRARLTRQLGRPPTDAETYLGHQQGSSGLTRIINDDVDNSIAKAMLNNPPPDGGGPTRQSEEFLRRWKNYFDLRSRGAIRQA